MVDPGARGVSLVELVILAAMMAGAVTGAVVGWIARKNPLLSIGGFIIGILSGMLAGTGMAHLFYIQDDGIVLPPVKAGMTSLLSCSVAGMIGTVPAALLAALLVATLTMRHFHPRLTRFKITLTGIMMGVVTGILTALVIALT